MRRNKGRGPQSDPAAAVTRTSVSPEPWSGGDSGGDEQASEHMSRQYDTARTNEPSPLGRRPQRKAAGTKHFSISYCCSIQCAEVSVCSNFQLGAINQMNDRKTSIMLSCP